MSTPRSPGWYPDPDGKPGERWWNGIGWSESKRDPGGRSFSAPLGAQPTPSGYYDSAAAQTQSLARPNPYAGLADTTRPRVVDLSGNRPATISLILGVLSLFFGILGIPAIILAFIGLHRAKTQPSGQAGKVASLIGLACGVVGLVLGAVPILVFFLTMAEFVAW